MTFSELRRATSDRAGMPVEPSRHSGRSRAAAQLSHLVVGQALRRPATTIDGNICLFKCLETECNAFGGEYELRGKTRNCI